MEVRGHKKTVQMHPKNTSPVRPLKTSLHRKTTTQNICCILCNDILLLILKLLITTSPTHFH